jgi:hypothetical protein
MHRRRGLTVTPPRFAFRFATCEPTRPLQGRVGVCGKVLPKAESSPAFRILATRSARALHRSRPLEIGRAQGRPGGRCTRGPRAKKLREAREPQVQAVTTGLPCAVVYGLYALSPVNQRLPPSSAQCASIVANLAPAWARQDHTTSPSASTLLVSQRMRVHRIPPHVRDDREAPLFAGAGREEHC